MSQDEICKQNVQLLQMRENQSIVKFNSWAAQIVCQYSASQVLNYFSKI